MAENSKIQWTDHTFNPWSGCSKVHAGCTNCYAEVNYSVKMRGVKWGPNGTRVKTVNWSEPLKWNRAAGDNYANYLSELPLHDEGDLAPYERPRVFCASLADVFEDWQGTIRDHNGIELCICHGCGKVVGYTENCGNGFDLCGRAPRKMTMDDLRRDLFAMIDATPNLDWLLLTKRPENVRRMWPRHIDGGDDPRLWSVQLGEQDGDRGSLPRYLRNVWLGTSISDQATAEQFVPELVKLHELAPVLFLLLGPIDLTKWLTSLSWTIVGGESGHHARPMRREWASSLLSQCKTAGVPAFMKQLGAVCIDEDEGEFGERRVPLSDPKGGDWSEWPEELRVRQFPEVVA